MRWIPHTATIVLLAGLVAPCPGAVAGCRQRCGFRVARCVLERGGVDGLEQAPCRRDAVRACRTRRMACPLPDHDQLAATLAAVAAVEVPPHQDGPLCAAALAALPVATVTDAIALGRITAAALVGTTDPGFHTAGVHAGRTFEKLFLQGTLGHGAAFVPLGDVVLALARPARAVTWTDADLSKVAFGVVGVHAGQAVGIVLASCPRP